MLKQKLLTFAMVGATTTVMSIGTTFADNALTDVGQAARTTLYDITDKNSVSLTFDAASATLTDSQKSQLKSLLDAANRDGKIENIVVAAYADKNYPKDQKDSLAKVDRDMAAKRGDAVRAYLTGVGAKSVAIYNMAEKANWFERTLVTKDAMVKGEAREKADDVSRDDAFFESLGRHLTKDGGAGKVIVLLRHELPKSAS